MWQNRTSDGWGANQRILLSLNGARLTGADVGWFAGGCVAVWAARAGIGLAELRWRARQ